jgi:lactoylglutathione lyase
MKLYHYLLIAVFFVFSIDSLSAQQINSQQSAALNHIAVYVSDLAKSESFYQTLLNLKKIEEPFKDGRHVWFSLGAAGQMHLIQGPKTKTVYDKNEHLCFSVNSITAFISKLDQEKVDYINWEGTAKAPTTRVDGVKQVYFQDPDGHWLEVNDAR